MAKTPSAMIPLGTKAPEFSLVDTVSGKRVTLEDIRSEVATVVMFICNHCPFVKHVQDELARLGKEYQKKGVSFAAISSNDPQAYPEDAPAEMKKLALRLGFSFPYLFDETQEVARAYQATCTPDFFVFDRELKCVYRGQLDDSRPESKTPVTGADLRAALDAILDGRRVSADQKPSVGCNIKWR